MKRLVTMVLLLALLLCGCNSMDLYEYALTMESDNSFACTDGYIYKYVNKQTNINEAGRLTLSSSLVWSGNLTGWNSGATTNKKRAKNMEPHDFIFASKNTALIRNDGSIWYSHLGQLHPFSPHNEAAPADSPYELSMTITQSPRYGSIKVTLTNNGEATLPSPYVYLFVQLKDGSWYDCKSNDYVHCGKVYGVDYSAPIAPDGAPSQYVLLDIDIDMEQGDTREYHINLPRNGKKFIPGKYRVVVYSNLANEDTLFDNGNSYYTYFTDTAQFEAYVEFELSNAPFKSFKLSDFESTIEDLTVN